MAASRQGGSMMDPLASAALASYARRENKARQDGRGRAAKRRERAKVNTRLRRRRKVKTPQAIKPWNRDCEMVLHLCTSAIVTLAELDERDWVAKHEQV